MRKCGERGLCGHHAFPPGNSRPCGVRGGRGRGKRRGRVGRVAPGGCRTEHLPPHGARRLLGPAREKPRLRASHRSRKRPPSLASVPV